jgi:hypothetical protein
MPAVMAETPEREKIASVLREAVAAVRDRVTLGLTVNLSTMSTDLVRIRNTGEVQVYVIVTDASPANVALLESLGLRVELILADHGLIQGWVAHDAIDRIAALDFVKEIRPPGYPVHRNVGSAGTLGDSVLRADQARSAFGVTGAGVTVGVMSDGVSHLANAVASGDLPAGVVVLKNPGGDEGTAMLEIVHDLAPDAGLAFYGPMTSADMVAGINALAAAGARVVVDDILFFDEPKFQDGMIAQAARNFVTGGKVYVTAAGNEAQRHYRANYSPTSGNAPFFHDYGAGDIGNSFSVPNNCNVRVILQWSNPNGASADNFDLFLARSSDGVVLTSSQNSQSGTQNAYEMLSFTNTTGASLPVFIAIGEVSLSTIPSSTLILDYFVYPSCGLPALQYTVATDSVIGHAAVSEVLSVAALNASTPTSAEPYSSRGPASISFPSAESRSVPTISGVDCVTTEVGLLGFFPQPFCGTSASAPHVAAIAALVISRNPGLDSSDIVSIVTDSAVDLGSVGFDFIFGFGRADALNAVTATPVASVQSLTPDKASPQVVGTAVKWMAVASGGTAPLQYQFFSRRVEDGGGFFVVQAWSPSASVTLAPMVVGTYQIAVWVRSNGGVNAEAGAVAANFVFTASVPPPVTIQGLAPDKASPQVVGTAVKWTATASGGAAPLQYQFFSRRVEDGGGFFVAQAWSPSASVTLAPMVAGTYQIAVWVRSNGGSAPEAGFIAANFTIGP